MTDTPTSVLPLCPHFGVCGGCQHQDKSYADQLELKAGGLYELFGEFVSAPPTVVGSPEAWYYRNKTEYKFDRMQYDEPPPPDFPRETVLGFRRGGRWYWTLDLTECRLMSPVVGDLLAGIREWYRREGVGYFDSRKKTGTLQHLVLREGKRTGDRMVILITGPTEVELGGFVQAVLDACPATSILHAVNTGNADVARGDELRVLHGEPWLHEELCIPDGEWGERRLRFRISPFGFFQVNPWGTELLYGHLRRIVREVAPHTLYDLYGGSGGIALSCSDLVERVVSVEEYGPASEDGVLNAEANGVANVEFVTRRVEGWLGDMIRLAKWMPDSLAILDPPRAALHPKALRRMLAIGPPHVLYVSCNPKLLARELGEFLVDYELRDFRAFDLFPQTKHVEAVAWLVRKPEAAVCTPEDLPAS